MLPLMSLIPTFKNTLSTVVETVMERIPVVDPKVLLSLLALVIVLALRRLILAALRRRSLEEGGHYRWRKITAYVSFVVVSLLLGSIWLENVRSFGTFLGLVSAGLAIALRDLVMGIAGWAFLLWRRPFVVGDRVELGDHRGDVIDIRLFKFTLMEIGNWVAADQSTGRVVHVPNGRVLTEVIVNYTRGFRYIWNEIPVTISYESDWKKAKKILTEVAEEATGHLVEEAQEGLKDAAQRYLLYYRRLTPIVYTSMEPHGVCLTVRHLSPPRGRRGLNQAITESILDRFDEHLDIELAYPTQRFYDRVREGDPPAE